ncbi:MAG: hypothetical protein ABFE07_23550 [Armatimonadia bacterium]
MGKVAQDVNQRKCKNTMGNGRAAEKAEIGDPLDEPGYQEFLCETAKMCRSRVQKPCPGCCAGGMCDGFLERDDDEYESPSCDEDENGDTP